MVRLVDVAVSLAALAGWMALISWLLTGMLASLSPAWTAAGMGPFTLPLLGGGVVTIR